MNHPNPYTEQPEYTNPIDPNWAQLAVDFMPEMLLGVLETGQIVITNKAVERLGYTQTELRSLNLADIVPDFTAAVWNQQWQASQQQERVDIRTECCTKDGRLQPVHISLKQVEYQGQALACLFAHSIQREESDEPMAKQIELLAQVNELSRELNLALSEASVFDIVATYIPKVIDADWTSIALLTDDEEHFQLYALTDSGQGRSLNTIYPLAGTNIEKAIQGKQLVVQLNTYDEALPHLLSHMNAPLIIGGKALGTLNVGSKKANAYSSHDEQILQHIAAKLAANINQRLLAQTEAALAAMEDEARRLELLNEMGQQMNLALNDNDIFDIAKRFTSQIVRTDQANIALLVDGGEYFEVFSLHESPNDALDGRRIPVWQTAAGLALRNRRVVNTPDLRQENLVDAQKLALQGLRSSLVAPIQIGDKIIGTLSVASKKIASYHKQDENLLLHLASFLGTTIANNQLFEELEVALANAEAANKAKSTFLANMSHELRTPLNAIIGFTRIVKRRARTVLPEKQLDNLDKVLVSAEHLLSLINTVLDIAKIEAGQSEVRPSSFAVSVLVDTCLMTAQPLVRRGKVKLVRDIPEDMPPIYADQDKVKQILLNLLSNAAKFTHEGEIRVTAEREENIFVLKVIDTGIGLSAQDLERIFEEFQQADSSTTRQYGGTGLGLSISRSLARLMGGDLVAESTENVGSIFTLTLPWRYGSRYATELDQKNQWTKDELIHSDRPIILAIDDNPDVIYILRDNLDEEGYLVVGATSGDEGLQKARDLKPLAITLDIMMPYKDGWQVLHELKVDPITKDIPVILLTIVDKKALGYRLGAADYLLKPLDEKQVIIALERLTGHRDNSSPKRLLIVDDDPQIPDMVRQLLIDMDYLVETAADGLEALAAIEKEPPDVILLDIMMPKLDGFGVLEKLQENPVYASIPIIVLTAKMLTTAENAILQESVTQVVQKQGLTANSLIREMQKALAENE